MRGCGLIAGLRTSGDGQLISTMVLRHRILGMLHFSLYPAWRITQLYQRPSLVQLVVLIRVVMDRASVASTTENPTMTICLIAVRHATAMKASAQIHRLPAAIMAVVLHAIVKVKKAAQTAAPTEPVYGLPPSNLSHVWYSCRTTALFSFGSGLSKGWLAD